MGIYDRDYYRDDDGGWWSRMAGKQATVGLVIGCSVVAVFQLLSDPRGPVDPLTRWGAFSQSAIEAGEVWRLVTPMFLTDLGLGGSLWAAAITILVLYFVGVAVEAVYGTREFLAFFLAAGFLVYLGRFVAGLLGTGFDDRPAVGSGSAVTAALVLYACHHTFERILLFFVIPVPVWALAAAVVTFGTLSQLKDEPRYPAYLVAALFALAYHRQQFRITDAWDRLVGSRVGRRPAPRLSVYHAPENVAEKPQPAHAGRADRKPAPGEGKSVDEQMEAKLDLVLEKVSRFGRDSLTQDETKILLRASEIYRRRREK